jgi:molybdate transport system substrate-binding protein
MKIRIAGFALALALALALVGLPGWATAAELRVFSTIGVQAALEELTPKFEQASGHKLSITWNTAAVLAKRVQAGETPDVVVLSRQSLDVLAKENKATPDATFASSGMGMVVKKGTVKPDISTPDLLKATLLKATAIAYSDPAHGGASGVFFAKLLERMGIAEAVKAKTKHPPQGGNAAVLVANGEAELAIQQVPEVIAVSGVDFVGELPEGTNNITSFAAGSVVGTKHEDAAKALVKFLHSPEAAAVFKARGLMPVTPPAPPKAS